MLPPPLSALPAKYWTSISLLVHSYSVGRLFQELVDAYSNFKESVDVPDNEEAFIIGFIHDMGQKLNIPNNSLDNVRKWVEDNLHQIKNGDINEKQLSKYIVTNVAETKRDPSYHQEVWDLLWLADHIQGTNNIGELITYVNEVKNKININFVTNYFHIASPHPLLKALLSKLIYDKINENVNDGRISFALPIGTSHGLFVVSDNPIKDLELEWDDIRYVFKYDSLLSDAESKDYWEKLEYCNKKDGNKHGVTKKYCSPLGSLRANTYETVILYYGPKDMAEKLNKEIVLPIDFNDELINIKIKGVKYQKGEYECPYCGTKTPHGVFLSLVADKIGKNAAKEKWSRRFPPAHLNSLLSKKDVYLACPLCLGEALIYSRLFMNMQGEKVMIANTYSAPIPISVAYDLGSLLSNLINKYNELIGREKSIESTLNIKEALDGLANTSTFAFDSFSTTIFGITGLKGDNIRITINGLALAGLLASWGLYPIVMGPEAPSSPSNKLLVFYKGQHPIYDFNPSDKELSSKIPYVTLLLMGERNLYYKKFVKKNSMPAVTEILDFNPLHAPHLLQYASPELYSYFESLLLQFEGGVS